MVRRPFPVLYGLVLLLGAPAAAQSYDLRLEKLGSPKANGDAANAAFRAFSRTFGAAMTSITMAPPETLGHSGFALAAELSVVDFRTSAALMPVAASGGLQGPLLLPWLHLRKGLPWSFELGARAGWIEKSRMGVASAELKWALNEGYQFLPDVGVRGHVSKLINARSLDLVAGGLDLSVGKGITLAGMMRLTLYVGWNLVFVGAASGQVDFRSDASLAEADATTEQFRDLDAFAAVLAMNNAHNRFYGGLRFAGGVVQLGFEASYALIPRVAGESADRGILAWNTSLGLQF